MLNKMQIDNHNFRKNITTNEKYILRKMRLKFCKLAFHINFVIKFELLPSSEATRDQRDHSGKHDIG